MINRCLFFGVVIMAFYFQIIKEDTITAIWYAAVGILLKLTQED